MQNDIVDRRYARGYAKTAASAINELIVAPKQGCGLQPEGEPVRKSCPGLIRNQAHRDGVESIDVGGCVVYGRIERHGVRAAVGDSIVTGVGLVEVAYGE